MKNWILMIMFALFSMFATACMSSDDSTTDDPTIEQPADPNVSTTESDVTLSCAGRCSLAYNQCIADTGDTCECSNARVVCRRACGFPGLLQQCGW